MEVTDDIVAHCKKSRILEVSLQETEHSDIILNIDNSQCFMFDIVCHMSNK
jgi:hypothetical protein